MAQSQVLNVHYLQLQQPESELSSPEPFHSSRLSLCWAPSDTGLSAQPRLPNGALKLPSLVVGPEMEDSQVNGCSSPPHGWEGLR